MTKIVRFPRATKNVKSVFDTALAKAHEQGWDKVIIIGEGKKMGHWITSQMRDHIGVGMIERAKKEMMDDTCS